MIVIQMPSAPTLEDHSTVLANMDIKEMVLSVKVSTKLYYCEYSFLLPVYHLAHELFSYDFIDQASISLEHWWLALTKQYAA